MDKNAYVWSLDFLSVWVSLLLLLLLLSILSKDTGSTKGKPVRGAPQLVTYIHTQIKIQHRYRNTTQIQNNTN